MPQRKHGHARLSVFKGREAKLNKTILQTLAQKGPLTIYDIHKQVKTQKGLRYTKYTNVNRRVRALEQSKYLEKTGTKQTLAGFEATLYTPTVRAYAALALRQINLDSFIKDAEDNEILQVLAIFGSHNGAR